MLLQLEAGIMRSKRTPALPAKAQVMVLKWEGVTLQRGDPKVCEGGKGVYG